MKIVFAVCLLFYFQTGFSRTVLLGTGSGSVSQTNMGSLKPGDTLAIRPGRYEKGGTFWSLTGITIINDKGLVEFGGPIGMGNLKMVTICGLGSGSLHYGFLFRNIKDDAFKIQERCYGLRISNCEYRDVDGTAVNASQYFVTYTGDSSTFALYKTTICEQKLVHSGGLFVGSWDWPKQFKNIVDSIAFLHILVDSTNSDVCQVVGQSIYRMLASHWRITGPCPNGRHDAGIFQTAGNGTVCNIYRSDGWGYIWRVWNFGLNGRADSYLYNCIDLGTKNYGTIDTRMEPGDTTTNDTIPFLRGANMHVLNNTIGNKKTQGYVSQLVITGHYCASSGYKLEIRNNLCFNTIATGYDQIVKQNTDEPLTDTSNNIYSRDPIADGILLDTVECKLNPAGPAIDKALNYPFIRVDIDGIPRPVGKSADIGAREFPDAAAIEYPKQGFFRYKWPLIGLVSLMVTTSAIIYYVRTRRKPVNADYILGSGLGL